MRKLLLAGAALAASLSLAACGTASTATTLKQFVASFGSQQYVQIRFTGGVSGGGSSEARSVLTQLSVTLRAENPSGGALSQGRGDASAELLVDLGTATLADVRVVDSNVYLKVDPAALSSIPGLPISASELAAGQLFFGGRWFEVPKSLIESVAPPPTVTRQQEAATRAIEGRLIDAIASYVDASSYKKTSSGYTESGTISQLVQALAPTIASIAHRALPVRRVGGSYAVTLSTSGSTVTGVSVSVTAPDGAGGVATATITAKVTHDAVGIAAPTGATTITPQLLQQLKAVG